MRLFTLFSLLIIFASSASIAQSSQAGYMLMPIDSVYDGDTIKTHVSVKRLRPPLNKLSIRIRGIDTPEKTWRASCDTERELADEARFFVLEIIGTRARMKVTNFKWGKYGGRIIGDVSVGGIDIGRALINAGLAIVYDGGKKTHSWCN